MHSLKEYTQGYTCLLIERHSVCSHSKRITPAFSRSRYKKMRNLLLVVSIGALCSGTNNSGSGRINSNKKGLCVSKKNFDCQDLALFPNISWYSCFWCYYLIHIALCIVEISFCFLSRYYNWGSEYHGQSCNYSPPGFIPMVLLLILILRRGRCCR